MYDKYIDIDTNENFISKYRPVISINETIK